MVHCGIGIFIELEANLSLKIPKLMTKTISIKYFSVLSDITGKREEEISVQSGDSLQEILGQLTDQFPKLEKYRPHIRAAVNQDYKDLDFIPSNNDEIVFITPVSGG